MELDCHTAFLMTQRSALGSLPLQLLATLAVSLYAVTRFVDLSDFPIFFFCDEAYIGAQIQQLASNGFVDRDGRFLPLFVEKAAGRWVPQVSLYLYLLPVLLFGISISILRGVTAAISLGGLLLLAAFLRRSCGVKHWWLAVAVAGALPVWMLHSRTAFETVLIIPFWCAALFFWGEWFRGNRWGAIGLPIAAALLFYSHFSLDPLLFRFARILPTPRGSSCVRDRSCWSEASYAASLSRETLGLP